MNSSMMAAGQEIGNHLAIDPETALKLINLIYKVETEEIIFFRGRAVLVRPACEGDLERVSKGYQCMD